MEQLRCSQVVYSASSVISSHIFLKEDDLPELVYQFSPDHVLAMALHLDV